MSSYPITSSVSASASASGSPSVKRVVSSVMVPRAASIGLLASGSTSRTFQRMLASPAVVVMISPTVSGRSLSFRYGASASLNASSAVPS